MGHVPKGTLRLPRVRPGGALENLYIYITLEAYFYPTGRPLHHTAASSLRRIKSSRQLDHGRTSVLLPLLDFILLKKTLTGEGQLSLAVF